MSEQQAAYTSKPNGNNRLTVSKLARSRFLLVSSCSLAEENNIICLPLLTKHLDHNYHIHCFQSRTNLYPLFVQLLPERDIPILPLHYTQTRPKNVSSCYPNMHNYTMNYELYGSIRVVSFQPYKYNFYSNMKLPKSFS